GLQLEPDIRMTQVRHAIDPKPVRAELKNAAVLFLLDQRQSERVPIKRNGLLVRVARTLDRDVRAARKLQPFAFGNHEVITPRRLCPALSLCSGPRGACAGLRAGFFSPVQSRVPFVRSWRSPWQFPRRDRNRSLARGWSPLPSKAPPARGSVLRSPRCLVRIFQ